MTRPQRKNQSQGASRRRWPQDKDQIKSGAVTHVYVSVDLKEETLSTKQKGQLESLRTWSHKNILGPSLLQFSLERGMYLKEKICVTFGAVLRAIK